MSDQNKRTEISELGEFGLVERLTKDRKPIQSSTLLGVGDDAAVIDNGDKLTVISTDLLVEGVHFDLLYFPLKHLGYKSVAVNLSDIYAMNATPKQITVSMAVSNRFSVEAIEEIYAGIYAACERYQVDLVGGDTTASPQGLLISITAVGQATSEKLVHRHTAKKGDFICITGDLGAAYMGLQILEREKQLYLSDPTIQPNLEEKSYLVGRQLKPEPRRDIIDAFANAQLVPTAMIDISDGLASDLMHICKRSGLGAFIEEGNVPIHTEAQLQALDFKLDPITCALSGGEDYELLFTIDPKDIEKVKFMSDIYIAGEMTDPKDGVMLHTTGGNVHPLTAQGWKHF